MKKTWLALLLLLGSSSFASPSDPQMFRAVIEDKACYATVYSGNEILLPSHCVSLPYETVSLEGIGPKRIEGIRPYAEDIDYDPFEVREQILIVRLTESIFSNGEKLTMEAPHPGSLDAIDPSATPCKIAYIERAKGFMAYRCQTWHGQSGRLLTQHGVPVGIHLGRLKSKGLAIAALDKGPFVDLQANFGDDFEPEKLKISCCKKLQKAVEKVGDAIQDGVDSVAKVIENVKNEIKRLEDDVKDLPKVFSVEYVKEKTAAIKTPKLPDFKVSSVKWPEMNLELPSIPDRWFKHAGKRIGQAFYMITELGGAFKFLWELIKETKVGTPDLCQGCDDPPPRDICAATATDQEKLQCIDDVEKSLQVINKQKADALIQLSPWLEAQKAQVGAE